VATSQQTPTPATRTTRRCLWAVRITTLLGPPVLIFSPEREPGCGGGWVWRGFDIKHPADLVEAILLTLPYLVILWRLAGPKYKRGLAMAVTMGAAGSLISFLFLITFGGPGGAGDAIRTASFMISQLALVATAVATYYSMEREAGDGRTLMMGFVTTAIYGVLLLIGMPVVASISRESGVPSQSSAVGSLRTLNLSEVAYETTYPGGYSPSLAALSGTENATSTASAAAAGLIDNVLASGKKNGYTFTYVPGLKDAHGKIQTYTISARPSLECHGSPSYFTDQTGVIHMTNEDRPATVNDPPLPG
jgi:hypothetical protein